MEKPLGKPNWNEVIKRHDITLAHAVLLANNIHPDDASLDRALAGRSEISKKLKSDLHTAASVLGSAFQPTVGSVPERSKDRWKKKIRLDEFVDWALTTLANESMPPQFLALAKSVAKPKVKSTPENVLSGAAQQRRESEEKGQLAAETTLPDEKAEIIIGLLILYIRDLAKQDKRSDRVLFNHGGLNEAKLAEIIADYAERRTDGGKNPRGGYQPATLRKRLASIRKQYFTDWEQPT